MQNIFLWYIISVNKSNGSPGLASFNFVKQQLALLEMDELIAWNVMFISC